MTHVWKRRRGALSWKAAHAFVDDAPQCHVARRAGAAFEACGEQPPAGKLCEACVDALVPIVLRARRQHRARH